MKELNDSVALSATNGCVSDDDRGLEVKVRYSGLSHVGIVSQSAIAAFGLASLLQQGLPHVRIENFCLQTISEGKKRSYSNVYVLDAMSSMDGLAQTLVKIRKTPTLLVCHERQLEEVVPYLRMGAMGVIHDTCDMTLMHEALYTIAKGELFIPADFHWRVLKSCLQTEKQRIKKISFTRTDKQIAKLLVKQMSTPEIAEHLEKSKATITTFLSRMRSMVGVGLGNQLRQYLIEHPELYED